MNPDRKDKKREQELSFLKIEEPLDAILILHSENGRKISHRFTSALKKRGIPIHEKEGKNDRIEEEAFLFRGNYAPFVLYFYQENDSLSELEHDLEAIRRWKSKTILILIHIKEEDDRIKDIIHGRNDTMKDFYRIYHINTILERKRSIRELTDLILSSYPYKEKYGSLAELKKRADTNDAKACYYLGIRYLSLPTSEEEKRLAIAYLAKACDKGYTKAKIELAHCYLTGNEVRKDEGKGFSLLQEIREKDGKTYYYLGECYDYGLGTEIKDSKAIHSYEQAIRYGNEDAFLPLSLLYSSMEEKKKKEELLSQAYRANRIGALYPLSREAFDDPEEKNNERLRLLRLGASCCEKDCLYELAERIYQKNQERYSPEAFKDSLLSAGYGKEEALVLLGRLFLDKRNPYHEERKAFLCFSIADQKDYLLSDYYLGKCYLEGKGTEKNEEKAFSYFLKGTKEGDQSCLCSLAYCYQYGYGVKKDLPTALKIYRELKEKEENNELKVEKDCLSIERNPLSCSLFLSSYLSLIGKEDPDEMNNVGEYYLRGFGVKKDCKEAFRWFTRASDKNSTKAYANLGRCYEKGLGTEKNIGVGLLVRQRYR